MDYYKILGVEKNATEEDILKAFRQQAKRFHPDISKEPKCEEKFKEVAQAYEVLGDKDRRQQYDLYGKSDGFSRPAGFNPFDLFNRMREQQTRRNLDKLVSVSLLFEEAVAGCEKEINIQCKGVCKSCQGTSVKTWRACAACKGTGTINSQQSFFNVAITCNHCQGQGRIPEEACKECTGGFVALKEEKIKVKIPAGVDNNMRVRMPELGDQDSSGNIRGDLYVLIKVNAHSFLQREGTSLFYKVSLPYTKLILGSKITIPTLKEEIEIKIPPNTKPGAKFKLSGKGVPDINNPNRVGDLFVLTSLKMPIMSKDYKQKLEELSVLEESFDKKETKSGNQKNE